MVRVRDTPFPQLLTPSSHAHPLGFTFQAVGFPVPCISPVLTAGLVSFLLIPGEYLSHPTRVVPLISSLHWYHGLLKGMDRELLTHPQQWQKGHCK